MNIFSQFGLALAWGLAMAINQGQAWEPLLCHYGVGTAVHPIQKPANAPEAGCGADHVYIFAINGLDPLCVGNFNGLCGLSQATRLCEHRLCPALHGNGNGRSDSGDSSLRSRGPHRADRLQPGMQSGSQRRPSLGRGRHPGGIVDLHVWGHAFRLAAEHSRQCLPHPKPRVPRHASDGRRPFYERPHSSGARNCRINALHLGGPSKLETVSLILEELSTLSSAPACPTAPLPQNNGAVGVAPK